MQGDATETRGQRWLGCCAIAGYVIHGAYHLARGEPEDLIWVCHFAAPIIGVGLIAASPSLVSTGTVILCMGTPLWIFDLAQGGEFMPTSLFTHVLGLAIGLWGVWKLGPIKGAWWRAALTTVALVGLSRLITPPVSNINMAFAIPHGMDRYFASHAVYLTAMLFISCVYYRAIESLLRLAVGAGKSGEITSCGNPQHRKRFTRKFSCGPRSQASFSV